MKAVNDLYPHKRFTSIAALQILKNYSDFAIGDVTAAIEWVYARDPDQPLEWSRVTRRLLFLRGKEKTSNDDGRDGDRAWLRTFGHVGAGVLRADADGRIDGNELGEIVWAISNGLEWRSNDRVRPIAEAGSAMAEHWASRVKLRHSKVRAIDWTLDAALAAWRAEVMTKMEVFARARGIELEWEFTTDQDAPLADVSPF